ncbi:nitrogen regulation protein NR(II) [Salinisphaera hydrothermalis]|uniref:Sensory histidine kinase/phosphatase NtrB n=1 Tax=Salinisphaera hydrothermalis (strain C41B8) TaxID=1304275 RepID=A0A084ILY8_SALHC|nr:nitrogen regulation protein NR(II) [Salinisphaera hydrothermalis]KEZ77722.1 signal transduction histidine kinase, nitrogen specific, NtrB [Salinisphaera hydrothermalis C41B8]
MRSEDHNEHRPDTILDNLKTAVVCLDDQLRVTYLNTASEMLFGVSARHCDQEAFDKALPYLADHRGRLIAALTEGAAYTERELHLRAGGGDPLIVDCTVTPFTDQAGESALLLEFLSLDRQLRISRDDQMRIQNLANREMIRGMAHEIKNPLGGLRGAAQLLEREIDDDGLKEYTTVIIREADRLQNLVDDLLGPRRPPNKQLLNIHEPLEHVRALIDTELPPGITLERDYDPSIPEVRADREQLIQTFFNLVGNAVTALGTSGNILLRTRTQRLFTIGGVKHRLVTRVDVVDNGPGIPRDLLPRIFHPMVSSRAEGTGMGLPIAQYLIHLHDGLIECESRPGQTMFSVFLPMEASDG